MTGIEDTIQDRKWVYEDSLNSDCHQFNHYQQNEQSALILTFEYKGQRNLTLEIHVLAWDRHKMRRG